MGVMACDRHGCEEIMAQYYGSGYGSLCSNCFSELVKRGVKTDVEEFMRSCKPRAVSYEEQEATETYFKTIFRDRYEDE